MAKFKLLAGLHIQKDETAKPDKDGNQPSVTYKAGDIVESETDLVEKFGPGKFEPIQVAQPRRGRKAKPVGEEVEEVPSHYLPADTSIGPRLPGDPTPELAKKSPAVAPGGQVSTGKQEAREPVGESPPSGPVPPEKFAGEEEDEDFFPDDDDDEDEDEDEPEEELSKAPARPAAKAPASKTPQSDKEYHAVLDRMTVQQLKDHAAEEKVDLGSLNRKDEILRKLKAPRR